MKQTGMVRKIDELGRVVIPKEIRDVLKLSVGMQLEIYINEKSELVLKKFSPVTPLEEMAQEFCNVLHDMLNKSVFVCDKETIIAYAGDNQKDFLNKEVNEQLAGLVCSSSNYVATELDGTTMINITTEKLANCKGQLIFPLMAGDVCEGLIGVLSFKEDEISPQDIKSVELVAKYISRQLKSES